MATKSRKQPAGKTMDHDGPSKRPGRPGPVEPIKFYSQHGQYGCFSNFYPVRVFYDGRYWRSSEHAFQAAKFSDRPALMAKVRDANSPMDAARIGRNRTNRPKADWERIKDGVMYGVVYSKFQGNKDLTDILLSTGDAQLIEHTDNDDYWGDGGNGKGRNQLGKTLMRVREELWKHPELKPAYGALRPPGVKSKY